MAKSAVKRLKQDLQQLMDEPIIGANAVPDDTDMFTWYAMVVPPKGSKYADIPVRFVLEFTDKYPNEPPKGFFETDVRYQGGASYMVNNRMSVCLDLFGNFAHVHTEWKSQSSGWSPAYSVHTILLNMQALMESEFISQQPSDVKRTTEAAKKFICAKSGHNGSDPKKWVPQVLRTEKELADFIAERRASGVAPMDVTEEKKAGPNPLRDEYICYVTGSNVHRDSAILGFGVHVENPRSGILSSPCEYLSLEAFTSGTRNSTTNKQFEYWLPIKVNSELWNEDRFRARIDEIAKGVKLADAKGFPLSFEGNVLRICASLMTSALVEICKNAGEQTANDKFINAFFALYRLMQHVATSDKKNATPAIISLANEKVRTFIENPKDRVKSVCPNLGELLVALIMSDKYSWADLAPSFIDENDTRNVFWYAIGNYNSPAAYPQLADPSKVMGRAQQVFQATETSRNLVKCSKPQRRVATSCSSKSGSAMRPRLCPASSSTLTSVSRLLISAPI